MGNRFEFLQDVLTSGFALQTGCFCMAWATQRSQGDWLLLVTKVLAQKLPQRSPWPPIVLFCWLQSTYFLTFINLLLIFFSPLLESTPWEKAPYLLYYVYLNLYKGLKAYFWINEYKTLSRSPQALSALSKSWGTPPIPEFSALCPLGNKPSQFSTQRFTDWLEKLNFQTRFFEN